MKSARIDLAAADDDELLSAAGVYLDEIYQLLDQSTHVPPADAAASRNHVDRYNRRSDKAHEILSEIERRGPVSVLKMEYWLEADNPKRRLMAAFFIGKIKLDTALPVLKQLADIPHRELADGRIDEVAAGIRIEAANILWFFLKGGKNPDETFGTRFWEE